MIMYKLKDGDIVKILPIVKKKGDFLPIEDLRSFFIGGKTIYDTIESHLKFALRKKSYEQGLYNDLSNNSQTTRFALCIYHEGEIKFTLVGKKIKDILLNIYNFDQRNNHQLKVRIEMINTHIGIPLPSFDKCEVIQKEWNKPDIDVNSQEAWFEWLRVNQPFYIEDYVENNNVYKNIDILKREGLSDYIYEIIAENREKKINQLLTS